VKPYGKPPLSVPEQLALLRERGIEITDPDAAQIALQQVSYYRLSGYCLPFKDGDKQYAPGTQLSTILELYEMDRRLRLVLLDGIERVEVALRCTVSNTFALRYGTFGHLQAASFRANFDPRRHVKHADWLRDIQRAAHRSTELFIDHHKNHYHGFPDLPVWKMAEVITLGDLSMWFAALRDEDRTPIAESYGVAHVVLASWLHSIAHVRNICAHHSRLWDRNLSIRPRTPKHDNRWLPPLVPRRDRIWIVLLILRQMLAQHHAGQDWQAEVEELLGPLNQVARLRDRMGLPEDWLDHPLWNVG
jgi:abortive infection bacteriophage resistance protein